MMTRQHRSRQIAKAATATRVYTAQGFCEIGLRVGYYPAAQGREDALVMAKELAVMADPVD